MASPRPPHFNNPASYPLPNGAVSATAGGATAPAPAIATVPTPGPVSTTPVPATVQPVPGVTPAHHVPTPIPVLPGGVQPLLPNQGRIIQTGPVRVLCVADVRGNLKSLNELAAQARADHIIHTGDFGFYDNSSLERIAEKTLRHVVQYSPLVTAPVKESVQKTPVQQSIKQRFTSDQLPLSELPLLLSGQLTLNVPVYTVWGACEDVRVLEKFRSGDYKVHNLNIIDEASSRLLDVGGVKLRLLGLGGAVVMHKLFDNGEGRTTIAGGQGTMWTTLLQMGELVDTANRVYDPSETRIFVTHTSPAREGMLNQLSVTLKADFSVSAGLHFRYGSSYNEFSVNPSLDYYRGKLAASKFSFNDVWDTVKGEVEAAINSNEAQRTLLDSALGIVQKMPTVANGGNPFGGSAGNTDAGQVDESAFKNMWNFNLADAAFGWLVLEIEGGRIGTEMRAQGFNFSHRTGKHNQHHHPTQPHLTAPPTAGGPAPSPVPVAGTPAPQFGQAPPMQAPVSITTGGTPRPPASFPGGQVPQQQSPPSTSSQQAKTVVGKPVSPVPVPAIPKVATPVQAPTTTVGAAPAASAAPASALTPATGAAAAAPADAPSGPAAEAPEKSSTPAPPSGTERTGTPATPTTTERRPALFISNVDNEPAIRDLFPEPENSKIVKVEKWGKFNYVVTFTTLDAARSAYERQPAEHKKTVPVPPGAQRKPNVKWFEERPHRAHQHRNNTDRDSSNRGSGERSEGGNAGTWQGSSRGGARGSGYQSGSATSDTDGGRRGFRGGRGRGMDRGRGSGRGGTGNGRGGYKSAQEGGITKEGGEKEGNKDGKNDKPAGEKSNGDA